jgi:hypothetical protein
VCFDSHTWVLGTRASRQVLRLTPSNPLLPPHEVVDLGDEDQKRNGIPIFLADEIDIEFACPFVCYVFPLSVFRTNCVVNVMTDLMEEHMSKPEFSQECDAKRNGR